MKNAIDTNHRVIPAADPGWAWGSALNGGYIVHPAAAGPASTKSEAIINADDIKNNQYEIILRKPDAISLAPICNGINRLLNVPLNPAVKTKKTIIVPWIVTRAK